MPQPLHHPSVFPGNDSVFPGPAISAFDDDDAAPSQVDDQPDSDGLDGHLQDGRHGLRLGDFEVGGLIGQGGMGTVYHGWQHSLSRRVAIKILSPALAGNPKLVERFASEARIASLIRSPQVVQVFGAGRDGDTCWFAMEFVEGRDLAAILRDRQPTWNEAIGWIAQAARGLAAAHAVQAVHRDLKPANLLLADDGTVKIADFGLARLAEGAHLTRTGVIVGTPAYCSPEQGRGQTADPRSDLYGLGVVFYELLTGRLPFIGDSTEAVVFQHNYAEPPRPCSLVPGIPAPVEAACLRLLMKDPALRYASAADLADDLERLAAGHTVRIPPYQPKFGTGAAIALARHLGWRRHRRLILATVAATAVLVVAAAWFWGGRTWADNQIARHRAALAPLDRTASVPLSAPSELAWMREHLGAEHPDVQRWAAKLARVDDLRQRLARLDNTAEPDALLRRQCTLDLAAWVAEVGLDDPDALRWRDLLAQADTTTQRIADPLSALDRDFAPTRALLDRLDAALQDHARLAGADHPDQVRWRSRSSALRSLAAARAQRLARLDRDAPPPESALPRLAEDLAAHRTWDDTDEACRRWEQRLYLWRGRFAAWRDNLARLDRVDPVPLALAVELGPELAQLTAVADADDPAVVRWQLRCREARDTAQHLRQHLQRLLADDAPLPVPVQTEAQSACDRYRLLVSPDDGALPVFTARLTRERVDQQRDLATLARLQLRAPLPLSEQRACRAALEATRARQAVAKDRLERWQERLDQEAARVDRLRQAVREALAGRFVPSHQTEVDALAADAGLDDPDVQVWLGRAARHRFLREQLRALDLKAPLPEQAQALLDEFRTLVGTHHGDARRWADKLARVQALLARLAPLRQPGRPPADALAALQDLTAQLGPDDAQVQAFTQRLDRITSLIQQASAIDRLWVPASAAQALVDELAGLIGNEDPGLVAWRRRLALLADPPIPAWASDHGRDLHGTWIVGSVDGVRQRLRFVMSGSLSIGSPPEAPDRDNDEGPVVASITQPLWMADSECTQALYRAVTGRSPSAYPGPDLPVDSVTRFEAAAFCDLLAQRIPGCAARLPTEYEWELACRAGHAGTWIGPTGPLPAEQLAALAQLGGAPAAVCGRLPNPIGLYDLHGNVWEWCSDGYATYPLAIVPDHRGVGDAGVVRGGSWSDRPALLRAANRVRFDPESAMRTVGFRFVVPMTSSTP